MRLISRASRPASLAAIARRAAPASARSSPADICSTEDGRDASAARVDAREQLRTAREMLETMGFDAFAERAQRELLATGETARKRTVDTRDDLTAQEAQIARLARPSARLIGVVTMDSHR
jgi:hypothetical protein